ncbi:MAG: N-acetyl-gamma-glutamyl-phosphate reductase, partial [Dysgonamonadaceae bacterium]|nr:N-acetyl-gamma-glutamyl-phosphate reductase [Dysgonamonadaceae bacterium]
MKIKTGIIGGAGYTAGELIRLLINHPSAEIEFVHSSSNAGNDITYVHEGLIGDTNLQFADSYDLNTIDVLFLCSAHGDSRKFIETNHIPDKLKIIDLSTDYRHKSTAEGFVYGLPELNKEAITKTNHLANPGCYATAIQLAILPLAAKNLLKDEVHVSAITGSTGAGVKPTFSSHFSWRNDNVSVYKVFEHQHLKEIRESVLQLQPDFDKDINFIPIRGNFSRGIFANVYTNCDLSVEEATDIYRCFYKDSPFVFLSEKNYDLKQVVNTNKCILHLEKHG